MQYAVSRLKVGGTEQAPKVIAPATSARLLVQLGALAMVSEPPFSSVLLAHSVVSCEIYHFDETSTISTQQLCIFGLLLGRLRRLDVVVVDYSSVEDRSMWGRGDSEAYSVRILRPAEKRASEALTRL